MLTLENARLIIEAVEEHTNAEVSIHEDYSGRGMYGKTCVGIVSNDVGAVYWAAGKIGLDYADIPHRQDSMGLDTILY